MSPEESLRKLLKDDPQLSREFDGIVSSIADRSGIEGDLEAARFAALEAQESMGAEAVLLDALYVVSLGVVSNLIWDWLSSGRRIETIEDRGEFEEDLGKRARAELVDLEKRAADGSKLRENAADVLVRQLDFYESVFRRASGDD